LDYVKELRPTFERINPTRPVGVAAGKEFCSRAIPGPGPSQNSASCGSPPTRCTPVSREERKETDISRPKVSFLPPRAAQLRVGPVPNINCPDKRASPYLALFLQGMKFNLPAIPPHLCREESRQKCSGQAGGGPSVRWRRQCQFVPRQSRSPNSHRLRRWLGARPCGQERHTFVPAVGRPGPGPGGRLSNPSAAGLWRGLGA